MERASPLSFVGPLRFFATPLPLAELPPIDAVVISHDHYDHLDMATVQALSPRGVRWLVPLGVGARLAGCGVPDSLVTEMDWWEATRVGNLTITATPARHFSARSLTDRDRTLWAGWAIAGPHHRVFYSGDTALHDGFLEIGTRLGPFDLTMIEVGEYNALWADVHLGPEQAVLAHRLVRGGVMLPVHWAGFDLAAVSMGHCTTGLRGSIRAGGVRRYPPSVSSRKRSAGVRHPSVSRGRPLSSVAMASRSAWVKALRSAALGRYCRRSPFVFSFVPRCQGLRGSQLG